MIRLVQQRQPLRDGLLIGVVDGIVSAPAIIREAPADQDLRGFFVSELSVAFVRNFKGFGSATATPTPSRLFTYHSRPNSLCIRYVYA